MAKIDFEEDFLQIVKEIHFGSLWVEITTVWSPGNSTPPGQGTHVTVSFPGEAGGTPGYDMGRGLQPNPVFRALPLRVTDAMLKQSFKPGAGAAFVGFGTRNVQSFGLRAVVLSSVMLKCGGALDQKFNVRVAAEIVAVQQDAVTVVVALHSGVPKKDTVVRVIDSPTGYQAGALGFVPQPSGDVVATDFQELPNNMLSINGTWSVDTEKRKVAFLG